MIDINTTINECGKPLNCFSVEITTDNYKTAECSDSFVTFKLSSQPVDGNDFTIHLEDTNGVVLIDVNLIFKSTPTAANHIQLGANLEDTGTNTLDKLTSISQIIGICQVTGQYNGGLTPDYQITLTYICAVADFTLTVSTSPITDVNITTASTELTFEQNFKVNGLVIDCPFDNRPAYSTLISGIEIYFDKNQSAIVNLANRLSSYVRTEKPDINNTLQYLNEYQRIIKLLFTESIEGAEGDSASTGEFYLRNTYESLDCFGFYNQFDLDLCRGQAAFAYFFVKHPDNATIYIKDENGDTLYSSAVNLPGLWSLNVMYEYLVNEEIITEGTGSITVQLREDYGAEYDLYTLNVSYSCECTGDKSFVFMTDRGIFEPIMFREINNKVKTTKSLFTLCEPCESGTSIFNVDTEYTYTFVSPRLNDSNNALKYVKFLSSKKIYGLSGGELIEAFDEGGSYDFRLDRANEFTIDIKTNI